MGKDLYRSIGLVLVTIIAALGAAAAIHVLVTLPFPDNKGAEWVGAIGTVATLVGTLWLATTETRRRLRQERLAAFVHATSISIRLTYAEASLNAVAELLNRGLENGLFSTELLQNCHNQLVLIKEVKAEDVVPLAAMKEEVAKIVISAASAINLILHVSEVGMQHAKRHEIEKHMSTMLGATKQALQMVKIARSHLL